MIILGEFGESQNIFSTQSNSPLWEVILIFCGYMIKDINGCQCNCNFQGHIHEKWEIMDGLISDIHNISLGLMIVKWGFQKCFRQTLMHITFALNIYII